MTEDDDDIQDYKKPWVGLTDEDISEIVRGTHNTGSFIRVIEAKLKEKNTPAFPYSVDNGEIVKYVTGMTLRDYFAAKALQGMMVDVYAPDCDYIAKTTYAMADAMLKAREE